MKCKVVAITGTIGSGKSTVSNYLQKLGYPVISCDEIGKNVANDKTVQNEVASLLGEEYVVDGKLQFKKIRLKIFSDENLLKQYNNVFFPRINDQLKALIESITGIVFVEIPIFSAVDVCWHQVWNVVADSSVQVQRVTIRDNVNTQNVLEIMSRQEVVGSATHIINNNGTIENLYKQVDALLKGLTNEI